MNPICILWVLIPLSGINAEKLTVIQTVPRILAKEGQTVFLPCTYTANLSNVIGAYNWYKDGRNGTEVYNETAEYKGRIYRHKEDFIHARDASILLKDVRVSDSGVYYCKVRLMQLGEEYGAGTKLTVRGSMSANTVLYIVRGVVVITMIISILFWRMGAILSICPSFGVMKAHWPISAQATELM